MRAGPLWRNAPLRLVRQPGWFAVLCAAAAVLAACVASVPLFERSVDSASVETEIAAAAGASRYQASPDLRVVVPGVLPPRADEGLRELLDELPELGAPVVTAYGFAERSDPRRTTSVLRAGGRETRASLHYRDGAVELLTAELGGSGAPGVWVSEEVAEELGVGVGGQVVLHVGRRGVIADPAAADEEAGAGGPTEDVPEPPVADATVVGTFPTADGEVTPDLGPADAWVSTPRDLPTAGDGRGRSAMVLADRETFDRLALDSGEEPLWVADIALVADPSPDAARRAATAVRELGRTAFQEYSAVDRFTRQALPWPSSAQVVSGLPDVVSRAGAAAATARAQVRSMAWAAIPLGVLAVGSGVLLLRRSRRAENELAAGLGLRSTAAGVLAGVEAAAPLALGALAGALVAWGAVVALGPSSRLGPDAWAVALGAAGVALLVALVAVVLGVTVTAALSARSTSSALGRSSRRVPWEAVVVTGAVVAAAGIVRDTSGRGVDSAPGVLSVVLPLLVAAAVAVLAHRAVGLRRAPSARSRPGDPPRGRGATARRRGSVVGSAGWLAARRVRRAGREATATVVVVAVGLSLALWAVAADRGVDRGTTDKVAALAGAETVVAVIGSWPYSDPPPEPPDPRDPAAEPYVPVPRLDPATFVWRSRVSLPPVFGQLDLLVVDPGRFEEVALWGSGGPLEAGRSALPALADGPLGDGSGQASGGPEIPVIMVGGPHRVGDRGTLNMRDEWAVRFEVVGVTEAFPGVGGRGVVAGARSVLSALPDHLDPTVEPGGRPPGFSTQVWTDRPEDDPVLLTADLGNGEVTTRTQAEDSPGLRGARWPLAYLVALGIGAALLALVAVLLHAVRVADRDRLGELVLRHMGVPGRRLLQARAREIVGVLGWLRSRP